MTEAEKDVIRAQAACRAIIDRRNIPADHCKILVTAEHAITALLLALYNGDTQMAECMFNEGLVPGVESRLRDYASKQAQAKRH